MLQADDSGITTVTVVPCDCYGCNNTFVLECSVLGGGATIWQGTLFNQCQNQENIILRHSQFNNITGTAINYTCDGSISISAHAVDVNENAYTSRLTVVLSEDLTGRTVECANESKSIIGNYTILNTAGLIYNLLG